MCQIVTRGQPSGIFFGHTSTRTTVIRGGEWRGHQSGFEDVLWWKILPFPSFTKEWGTRWTLVGSDCHDGSPGTPPRKRVIWAIRTVAPVASPGGCTRNMSTFEKKNCVAPTSFQFSSMMMERLLGNSRAPREITCFVDIWPTDRVIRDFKKLASCTSLSFK